MSSKGLRGVGLGGGVASGPASVVRADASAQRSSATGASEAERASAALAAVAEQLGAWSERAQAEGRQDEAEILAASRLIAVDSVLLQDVRARAVEAGAEAAVEESARRHAERIEALDDPMLASRGSDVREVGRRVLRELSGASNLAPREGGAIVVAGDLGPADVVELLASRPSVAGFALAHGAPTSHAAIIGRAAGLPFVIGLGDDLLAVTDGVTLYVDGFEGTVVVAPGDELLRRGAGESDAPRLSAAGPAPALVRDGRPIGLLCNAATQFDVAEGLAAGAVGVGLLRTEIPFLRSAAWPTAAEHEAALRPILALLEGRVATVRTLDFGADKTPPFLRPEDGGRGIELALAHPGQLAGQLRAILKAGAGCELRILLPFVESPDAIERVRALLAAEMEDVGWTGSAPALGAMIETPTAVACSDELARRADFLSIGTNDLVQFALGLDRAGPAALESAADPRVLELIRQVVRNGHAEQKAVSVCGEAASDPALAALFVDLGVDALSVVASRLADVRQALGSRFAAVSTMM